jgi:small subunit ribosomal protein S5
MEKKPQQQRRRRDFGQKPEEKEFEQRLLDLSRVTRVTAGGKQMRFRACVAIGDKKGRVGVGIDKGPDVSMAIEKAVRQAKKNLVTVVTVNDTIPHWVKEKYGAAQIIIRPAARGKGLVAGGVVRIIAELAGIQNITAKMLGSNNKIVNARATLNALARLKKVI